MCMLQLTSGIHQSSDHGLTAFLTATSNNRSRNFFEFHKNFHRTPSNFSKILRIFTRRQVPIDGTCGDRPEWSKVNYSQAFYCDRLASGVASLVESFSRLPNIGYPGDQWPWRLNH